ncbi:MAG: hypothetical protein B6D76_15060 [gamma proteobacterium symbiont of Stewartia floridana]|nr:MAG: hypothetical protein B6D76_15060 [gamma proteobacterium symbiont of Stewartia floridana]RLW57690.1 MAG: hypothetical protein B6D75_16235 [gamma proteobacterium symbiont of Stewartia floridana]RLW66585.1 MAG: hypothetical protein B6D73_02325 [gamma proteobacterium symbiont of Stewartia floridana]
MYISIALLITGLILIALSLRQLLFKRRVLSATFSGVFGTFTLLIATIFTLLLMNVQTYVQLTREIDLVEVEVTDVSETGAELKLSYDGRTSTHLIAADEWRLDARFIKWKPWFTLFGKEPIVRLETISGRNYQKTPAQNQMYQLSDTSMNTDELFSYLTHKFGVLDTMFGSSVYMPIQSGARYLVSATHSGLIARPLNNQGRSAVNNWK